MLGQYWLDLTWWIYIVILSVAGYGVLLFFWWMAVNKFRASSVFLYTLIWLAGTAIMAGINVYARALHFQDLDLFYQFSHTIWWPMRFLPILIVLLVLCGHMTLRTVRFYKNRGASVLTKIVLNRDELYNLIIEYGNLMCLECEDHEEEHKKKVLAIRKRIEDLLKWTNQSE